MCHAVLRDFHAPQLNASAVGSYAKMLTDQQGQTRRTSASVLLLLQAEENMRANMESESCRRTTQVWTRRQGSALR